MKNSINSQRTPDHSIHLEQYLLILIALTALVLYPVFIAVAVPAESGVCALVLYVLTRPAQGILLDNDGNNRLIGCLE